LRVLAISWSNSVNNSSLMGMLAPWIQVGEVEA
jgi:hypothetical protein